MIDFSAITKAIATILTANVTATIERNAERNDDPDQAARSGIGWIGIYRGKVKYTPMYLGAGGDGLFHHEVQPQVELQAVSMQSGADAEDKLEYGLGLVMTALQSDMTLGGTVDHCNGYEVEYEYNKLEHIWFHSAIITILAEVA